MHSRAQEKTAFPQHALKICLTVAIHTCRIWPVLIISINASRKSPPAKAAGFFAFLPITSAHCTTPLGSSLDLVHPASRRHWQHGSLIGDAKAQTQHELMPDGRPLNGLPSGDGCAQRSRCLSLADSSMEECLETLATFKRGRYEQRQGCASANLHHPHCAGRNRRLRKFVTRPSPTGAVLPGIDHPASGIGVSKEWACAHEK